MRIITYIGEVKYSELIRSTSFSQIASVRQLMALELSWLFATSCGFYTLDQFFLLAKNRLHSGKVKKQQHARKFTSTIYVFKKCDKKKVKYLDFMSEEVEQEFINNLIKNTVK